MLLLAVLLAKPRLDQESMNGIVFCARNITVASILVGGFGQRPLSGSRA